MFRNRIKLRSLAVLCSALLVTLYSNARPNVNVTAPKKQAPLKTTAGGCTPATASIDLDINNVRSRLMTGGDMWWDQGTNTAAYEVPKGTKKNSLFAGSCWVGGIDAQKTLKVAAQTYRQTGNDYWPGPLNDRNGTFTTDAATCTDWDRFWKLDRVTVNKFKELAKSGNIAATQTDEYETIWRWPARGNGNNAIRNGNDYRRAVGTSGGELDMDDRDYAPYVEVGGVDNNPDLYNPEKGDYPNMENPGRGDQLIWWIFNDRGNVKQQTKTESIGLEMQTSAFAFSTKDFLNDATFFNYRVINRGGLILDSCYMATWTDADLGYYKDDYIGCDTVRGLGILYNAVPIDGNGEISSYGANPPMVGVDFFIGPKRHYTNPATGKDTFEKLKMQAFTYFDNNTDPRIGNPNNGTEIYYYMTGSQKNGEPFVNDFQAPGVPAKGLGLGPKIRFVFPGELDRDWSECNCKNPPDDRRFIHSAGPFQLPPGEANDIIIGAVWVANVGGCPNTSFKKIRVADDLAQDLFDNDFKTIEGPEAPKLVVREMDRSLIFYIVNPSQSNNFQEKYGYELDSSKYRIVSTKARAAKSNDTLYKFEGYRVFQLKSSTITPAQIFDERGEVDNTVAREVFQTDIHNGVKQLVNWTKNIDIDACDSCFTPVVKVSGKDSGIVHSFQLTEDAFATGSDKGLVNYRTYYYIAIAYAHNNFANFSPRLSEQTQDVVYLESAHGPGGAALGDQIKAAMPNPAYGAMGTDTATHYGAGVVIKRLLGLGNGGIDLQLDSASEAEALTGKYESPQPTYVAGNGPVNIKVVDPLKIVPANWTLYLEKDPTYSGNWVVSDYTPIQAPPIKDSLIVDSAARWKLVKDNNPDSVIYSERNLKVLNEQILENYGIALSIKQEVRPGDDQVNQNGYITSDISFKDQALAWLAGVPDGEQRSFLNWIRSGGNVDPIVNTKPGDPLCDFSDVAYDTAGQFYEGMLSNNSNTARTWAPYSLGATLIGNGINTLCNLPTTVYTSSSRALYDLYSVDIVFTNDKSKWSRCLVLESSIDPTIAEGGASKLTIRKHASWTGNADNDGNPIYGSDSGYSYFPGYAINQETGKRLNIVFAEDSWLKAHNGADMIWNPTSTLVDDQGNVVMGGRHIVYISSTKYDGCDSIAKIMKSASPISAYRTFMWTGMPMLAEGFKFLPLQDGLIPTETRLRFRVTRPYAHYVPTGANADLNTSNPGYPVYSFSTMDLAPKKLNDNGNPYADDKQKLLDRIHAVPNPYYAYNGYEKNRLDTRVRIINLPQRATVSIYSLDGSLIRKLEKDDKETSYIDWDIRNAKGLPIASGMYLIHVNAQGIGETVLRWFGSMRPVDVTNN